MARRARSREQHNTDLATDTRQASDTRTAHGVTLDWPVGPCRLVDGFVVTTGEWRDTYNPFRLYCPVGSSRQQETYHSLYVRLARLADAPDEELVRFCTLYGFPDWPLVTRGSGGEYTTLGLLREISPPGAPDRPQAQVLYPLVHVRRIARLLAISMRLCEFMANADVGPGSEGESSPASAALAELYTVLDELGPLAGWLRGEPARRDESYQGGDYECRGFIMLYWVGRPTDVLYHLAQTWGAKWYARDLADLTQEYWGSHFEFDSPAWREWVRRPVRPLSIHQRIERALDDLANIGHPNSPSYSSLKASLIAMLLRDRLGGGRFVVCAECGRPFYARHARRRFCPPDPDPASDNPYGCAKRRADRESARRRRAREREV